MPREGRMPDSETQGLNRAAAASTLPGRLVEAVQARWSRLPQRRWLLAPAALLLLVALLWIWRTVSQPRDRFWEHIQAAGQWRVAMDPSFPPFESLDDTGQVVGFDVDLARAIAARWGVEVKIESVGFDGLIDAVWASRVDAVVSAMPLQPQFSEDVAFSQPYFEAGLVVALPASDSPIQFLEDLAGRRVAVEWGSEGDVQARSLRRHWPDLQIMPMETARAALQAVADGSADAALVDHISALEFRANGGQVRLLLSETSGEAAMLLTLVSEPYVIVLPRKAPILQEKVGEALEAMEADGTLAALFAKWFGTAN